MQRVHGAGIDGAGGGHEGLTGHLAPEDPLAVLVGLHTAEDVHLDGLDVEQFEHVVERILLHRPGLARPARPRAVRPTLRPMGTIRVRGIDLAYDVTGTGPPLLWGHGLTSSRRHEDMPPALVDWPEVARVATVYRYDARGHGDSESTAEPATYSWAALSQDQLALADGLGLDGFALGGASMGAATALHTVVARPDRVERLVLVIPPTAWETRAAQVDAYLQMAALVEAGRVEHIIAARARLPVPDPYVNRPDYRERSEERLRAADPVRLARIYRGAATADLPEPDAIAGIAVPTLILAWTGDAAHPVSTATRLHELIAGSELVLASTGDELPGWTARIAAFVSPGDR